MTMTLRQLSQRINDEHKACVSSLRAGLDHAMNCGRMLAEAKDQVGHGGWLPWLQQNFNGSARTAQGYMRLALELPNRNTQRVADLPIREALKLVSSGPRKETLSADERRQLEECERTIERGLEKTKDLGALVGREKADRVFDAMLDALVDGADEGELRAIIARELAA